MVAFGQIGEVAAVVLAAASASTSSQKCSQYALVNARATSEAQNISSGFYSMDYGMLSGLSGGQIYDVVYPASEDQDSSQATSDIITHVRNAITNTPLNGSAALPPCMILQGYSQGASAVVDALQNLTDAAAMNVVRGVVLLGDPRHKPGLACNIDAQGQSTTRDSVGAENLLNFAAVPDAYISRTIDVCLYGDGICDTQHALGVNAVHQSYPYNDYVQSTGVVFMASVLSGMSFTIPPSS